GKDYVKVTQKCLTSSTGQNITNHQLTIPMAKEICMLQRSDKGKQFRQYFIKIEEQWNTPEAVMSRALQFANRKLDEIKNRNVKLTETVAVQNQQIAELKQKASCYDVVLNCKDLVSITEIAKNYGTSGKWLNEKLHKLGIQFKRGDGWSLYKKYANKGYTSTKTKIRHVSNGNVHTEVYTYWTQKGRLFIYDRLKKDGILPLIETNDAAV
ncbi:MAG: phage antirepressor KilAC domain-containing protein, partial [Bacteroidales bacterium]|nr:phage antirepressor KilAC domain-containing protein [Bacteroidales bacterium]